MVITHFAIKCMLLYEKTVQQQQHFIGAEDYNTCFNRLNAQTTCLTDFIRRNNLTLSWDHQVSNKDNTYNNFSLNHFSSIDHFIITHNIYDSIIPNNVINEVTNLSNHNAILLSFSLNINLTPKVKDKCDLFNSTHLWKRASNYNIQEYTYTFDKFLGEIQIQNPFLTAQSTQIKSVISVPIKDFIHHYPRALFNDIPRVGAHFYDIPGSGRSLTTYPGHR